MNDRNYLLFEIGCHDSQHSLYFNAATSGLSVELSTVRQKIINEINNFNDVDKLDAKDIYDTHKLNKIVINYDKMTKDLNEKLNLIINIPISMNNSSNPYFSDYELLKHYPYINNKLNIDINRTLYICRYNIQNILDISNLSLDMVSSHVHELIDYIYTLVERTNFLIDEHNDLLLEDINSVCSSRINQINNINQVYNSINFDNILKF